MSATPQNDNIPNAITTDELKKLMDKAPVSPETDSEEYLYAGMNKEQLTDYLSDTLDTLNEKLEREAPFATKLMLLMALANMVQWHTQVGMKCIEEGDPKSGVAWLRDAGKFQVMWGTLESINLGPNDFITPCD